MIPNHRVAENVFHPIKICVRVLLQMSTIDCQCTVTAAPWCGPAGKLTADIKLSLTVSQSHQARYLCYDH